MEILSSNFHIIANIFAIIAGYLFGSLPTGYIVVKLIAKTDIRTVGSGNIGGTNVGRVLGKKWAVAVTLVDMLKGGICVLICRCMGFHDAAIALVALAAVCGHNFPVWLHFKGGKGVATTFGTLFFLQIPHSSAAVLCAGIIWFIIMKTSRYVSLASILALLAVALFSLFAKVNAAFIYLALFLALLSICRHRENLKRIMNGTENKVGQKKA